MSSAQCGGVPGVKHFSELVAWQLARELRKAVYKLLARPAVRHDFDFVQQLRSSARGPARNIAEGFGRFRPRDFSRFLTIASASLDETENHLEDGITSPTGPGPRSKTRYGFAAAQDLQSAACNAISVTAIRSSTPDEYRSRGSGRKRREPREPKEPTEPKEPAEPNPGNPRNLRNQGNLRNPNPSVLLPLHRRRQPRDAFFDARLGRRRERQADELVAGRVDEERRPGDVDHAL